MSTQLIISKKITPPPTKTEVIDALLQIAFGEWSASKKEILAKKKTLETRLKAAAFKLSKKMAFDPANVHVHSYGSAPCVTVSHDVMDPSMKMDMDALKELEKSDTCWDENKERIEIRNALNGVKAGRVEAMLSDKDVRAKLVGIGQEIGVLEVSKLNP